MFRIFLSDHCGSPFCGSPFYEVVFPEPRIGIYRLYLKQRVTNPFPSTQSLNLVIIGGMVVDYIIHIVHCSRLQIVLSYIVLPLFKASDCAILYLPVHGIDNINSFLIVEVKHNKQSQLLGKTFYIDLNIKFRLNI